MFGFRLKLILAGAVLALVFVAVGLAPGSVAVQPGAAAAQLGPFDRTPQGRILFVKEGNVWLWQGGSARQFTDGGTWKQPSWSPDGQRIAYVYQAPHFSDVYVMGSAGGSFARLTTSQSSILEDNDWAFHPTWSPDGSRLAYTTDLATYNPTLWLMNADGTNKRHVFVPAGSYFGAVDGLSWSPDGASIVAAAFSAATSQLYQIDLGTGAARQLTDVPGGALDPAWSPDGSLLAYVARSGRRTVLHMMNADGSGSRPIADQSPARHPTWSPDGRHLAYISGQGGTFELWVMDVEAQGTEVRFSNARQLTRSLGIDALSAPSWTQ